MPAMLPDMLPSDEAVAEFRQWFAGSRIAGPDGRPRVLYHGTCSAEFDTFSASDFFGTGMFGKGINLTSDPVDAEKYASTDPAINHDLGSKAYRMAMLNIERYGEEAPWQYNESKKILTAGGSRILPVIVSMKKPLVLTRLGVDIPERFFLLAAAEIGKTREEAEILFARLQRRKPVEQFETMDQAHALRIYRQFATMKGYDGLVITPEVAPKAKGATHYLVMDPSQIRSAIEVAPLVTRAFPRPDVTKGLAANERASQLIEQHRTRQPENRYQRP